jgi:Flp pilus assembly protein TadD
MDVNRKLKKTIVCFHITSFSWLLGVLFFSILVPFATEYVAELAGLAFLCWFFFFALQFTLRYLKTGKKFAWVLAVFWSFYFCFSPFIVFSIIALVGLLSKETRQKFFSAKNISEEKAFKLAVLPKDRKRGVIALIVSAIVFVMVICAYIVLILFIAKIAQESRSDIQNAIIGLGSIVLALFFYSSLFAMINGILVTLRFQALSSDASVEKDFSDLPYKFHGWSWAGFSLGWVWGVYHRVYFSYLALIPIIGFFVRIVLGAKGYEYAWKRIKYANADHFLKSQKNWNWWGLMKLSLSSALILIYACVIINLAIASNKEADSAEVHRGNAIAAINRNDLGTAESELIKALELVGDDKELKARIYSNLGLVYNNSHRSVDDVNAMYQKAVDELDESYPGYFTYKGIIAINLGDEKAAIEYLKKGVEMKPNNFDALTALGNIYLRSTDPKIKDCNKAYEYFTRSDEVGVAGDGFKLSQAAICLEKYPEAIKILNKLLESGSYAEKSMIYYGLALAYGLNGDFALSEPYYIKAIELAPGMKSAEMDKLLCEGLKKIDCKY